MIYVKPSSCLLPYAFVLQTMSREQQQQQCVVRGIRIKRTDVVFFLLNL